MGCAMTKVPTNFGVMVKKYLTMSLKIRKSQEESGNVRKHEESSTMGQEAS